MLYNNEVQFLGMLIMTSLCTIIELTAAYPADMNREKCKSDGIYWQVHAGEMIPCSPTCDQVYRLTDRNDVSGKTIHEHCKLNTSVGKYYHDIANRTMCTCTNGAAYKSVSSIDWSSISEVTQWHCIPPSSWSFQLTKANTYRVVCL